MILHITAYSIRCLSLPFPTIFLPFFTRALVGDNILDFSGMLIVVAVLGLLCWIMSMMVSLIVSMFSNSYCASSRFINSSWNSNLFDAISVASTVGDLVINCFVSTFTSSSMLLIAIQWSLPVLTVLMTVTSVTMSGLFVTM